MAARSRPLESEFKLLDHSADWSNRLLATGYPNTNADVFVAFPKSHNSSKKKKGPMKDKQHSLERQNRCHTVGSRH